MTFIDFMPLIMFGLTAVLLFSGYQVAFVLGGMGIIFGLVGYYFDIFALQEFYNFVPRVWGGMASNLILVAVPMFIFMGTMLEKSGVAEDLLRALQVLLQRVPGGLALGVALLGTIMAAATGIIGASVVMMSVLALPIMLQGRYSKSLSTGSIAASSTLGILIPPSIMLVVMADLLSISVGSLFFAALLPGLLLAGLYCVYILVVCALKPELAPPMTAAEQAEDQRSTLRIILVSFVPPCLLIFLVLGSIFFGWATPTEASGIGALGASLLALVNRRLNWGVQKEVVERTARMVGMVFMVMIGATLFAYVFRSLGGDYLIEELFMQANLGPWGVLIFVMLLVFLLGFFFDWIEITLIVLPLFVPLIQVLDFGDHVDPLNVVPWFAILIAINLQTSFLTPPFGYALFFLKGVAPPEVKLGDIYRGVIPFVALQLIGLGLVMAFPQVALWLPQYMR